MLANTPSETPSNHRKDTPAPSPKDTPVPSPLMAARKCGTMDVEDYQPESLLSPKSLSKNLMDGISAAEPVAPVEMDSADLRLGFPHG